MPFYIHGYVDSLLKPVYALSGFKVRKFDAFVLLNSAHTPMGIKKLDLERCGTHLGGGLIETPLAFDGIFGFGSGPLSVVSQLSTCEIIPNSFSHCSKRYGNGEGILALGAIVESSIVSILLVLTLKPLCGTHLGGGLIETPLAFDGIFGFGSGPLSVVSQLSTCEIIPNSFSHCSKRYGNGEGILALGAIVESNLVLKDKIIVYDLANQQIGWMNYNCSMFVNVNVTLRKDKNNNSKAKHSSSIINSEFHHHL
uniref:Uncharacterized protein LOC101502104 n=1 Tax=Cicer arietinum TaxID=3827 RepID=A0A1S2Z218_CICAR